MELQEEFEREPPWWRKYVVLALGIFLLVLVVSSLYSDFIQGLVSSSVVEGNVLHFANATVVFENATRERLVGEFVAHQEREIKACFFGSRSGTLYNVTDVLFPDIARATVVEVVSVPCPKETLIDVHSHPINRCLASEQDLETYRGMLVQSPTVRLMVMCSQTRFALI